MGVNLAKLVSRVMRQEDWKARRVLLAWLPPLRRPQSSETRWQWMVGVRNAPPEHWTAGRWRELAPERGDTRPGG